MKREETYIKEVQTPEEFRAAIFDAIDAVIAVGKKATLKFEYRGATCEVFVEPGRVQ